MRFARSFPVWRALAPLLLPFVGVAAAPALLGCRHPLPVAPTYDAPKGTPIGDADLPTALAQYVFSKPGSDARVSIATALTERLIARAGVAASQQSIRRALATFRLAAAIARTNHVAPSSLSANAVAVLDRLVTRPASEGDEGIALGIYGFWTRARPDDPRPKEHLAALETWDATPKGIPSPLIAAADEAVRRSDAYGYSPALDDRAAADEAILRWVDRLADFREGLATPERFDDERHQAALATKTASLRIAIGHLRDGDVKGAAGALEAPELRELTPRVLLGALSAFDGGDESYARVLSALIDVARREHATELVADGMVGVALVAAPEHPHVPIFAEVVGGELLDFGLGDTTPAVFARALLGTSDDPRRPSAKELGRALSLTREAMGDFAQRDDFDAARRVFAAAKPLVEAGDRIADVAPSSGTIRAWMGLVESEAGRPDEARALFDEAIAEGKEPLAWIGKARLLAREGSLHEARALVAHALEMDPNGHGAVVRADASTLEGDLARRDGDVAKARASYEAALSILGAARVAAKPQDVPEIARRIVAILFHFADAREKQDDYTSIAESVSTAHPRVLAFVELARLARAMQHPDAKLARDTFHRASTLDLAPEDLVQIAVMARAIAKRAGASADIEVQKTLEQFAAKDDEAGRIAKSTLGSLAPDAMLAKAGTGRHLVTARFCVAVARWGGGGLAAAKNDLTAVAKADVVGSIESDIANDLLAPEHATIPGALKIAGI